MGFWMETGNSASHFNAAALAEEAAGGNRGTGLSPGEWKIDGGAYKAGINLDSSFKMNFKVHSITDAVAVVTIRESSMSMGDNFKQDYTNLRFNFARVGWGLFGSKKGYLNEGSFCTTANNCASAVFFEENQSKGRAKVMGFWMETGNSASHFNAAALAEEAAGGNRGTGLSPGEWKIDGGAYKAGINLDSSFKMNFKVHSITDAVAVVTIRESSMSMGDNFKQDYTNLRFNFARVGWGLF